MCFSKYLLSKSFRTQASITGPRMEPTAGKGPSPPDTSDAHWEEGPHPGGTVGGLAPGGWHKGDPRGEAWELDTVITRWGFPCPQEATLGEVALPPQPCPLAVPQEHLPVDAAPSQSVGLNRHPEVEYLLVFTYGDACPLN